MSGNALHKLVERAIRRSLGASRISSFDVIQPVWGGNGEVLQVNLVGAGVESVVVKHITIPGGIKGKKKNRDVSFARTLTSYDNELSFYQHYSKRLAQSVRIPHVYIGQRLEDGWVFVFENMLDSGFSMARKTYSERDIQGALKWLAGFHAAFMGSPGERLWKAGSYWNLASRETERAQICEPRLRACAAALDGALNHCRFKTLIHGDAKTDNFCFPNAETDGVVGLDFQYVGLGCGMKDVMCLLDSCLSPFDVGLEGASYLDFYFLQLTAALKERSEPMDAIAVEKEWRQLYPVAWADYYRFLDGWAPGKYPPEGHIEELLEKALQLLTWG